MDYSIHYIKSQDLGELQESEKHSGNPPSNYGFTKIPNNLLEAIAKATAQGIIVGKERAILDLVIRYTYGYNKKSTYLHTSFIADSLGLSNSWVSQMLKSLKTKKIIVRKGNEIQINENYTEWSRKSLDIPKQKTIKDRSNDKLKRKSLDTTKYLDRSKDSLDTTKYTTPTEQDKIQSQEMSKENIYKENKNYSVSLDTLGEGIDIIKDATRENSPDKKTQESKNTDNDIHRLIKEFYKEMGFTWFDEPKKNNMSVNKNYMAAKELLQSYSIEEVIQAVKNGKTFYIKNNKDPKMFIPNLKAVSNMIHVWLTTEQKTKQKETRKESKWT